MNRPAQGIALVSFLAVLVVVSLLVFGTLYVTQVSMFSTRNDVTTAQAEGVARAGLQKYKTVAFQSFRYYLDHLDTYGSDLAKYATCGNLLSIGLDTDRDGRPDLLSGGNATENISYDGLSGSYNIKFDVSGPNIVLRSTGRSNGATARTQLVAQGSNSGAFSNAIFAGGGGSGSRFLNGNGTVYGSVYVEGQRNSLGQADTIQMNGRFNIRNHYDASNLVSDLGRPSGTDYATWLKDAALTQDDMCSNLRILDGTLAVGGNATVGETENTSTTSKETMAGVYVNDGSSSAISGSTGNIHSDVTGPYDLNPPMRMPRLDDATTTPCKRDATKTWRTCMQEDAQASGFVATFTPTATKPTAFVSNIPNLPAQCQNELLDAIKVGNNTTYNNLQFDNSNLNCLVGVAPNQQGFVYTYNSADNTGSLTVYGQVDLRGIDVTFARNTVVRYQNKATILVEKNPPATGSGGNVTIAGDVLPGDTFPDRAVLGVVADGNLNITGDTQNQINVTQKQVVTGLFYAKDTVTLGNTTVMGSVMGTTIDGSNNPNSGSGGGTNFAAYQVPGLEYNLPPGFQNIRSDGIATFTVKSYERN